MKKFLGITLAVLLLLSAPLQAVSTYVDNSVTVTVNGSPVSADVVMHNNSVFVPLRFMSNQLDAQVNWDSKTRTVAIQKTGFIKKPVSSGTLTINGSKEFKDTINSSLSLLSRKSPDKYRMVTGNIKTISEIKLNTTFSKTVLANGTCLVDLNFFNTYSNNAKLTSNEKQIFLAGILVHEAHHSMMYNQGLFGYNHSPISSFEGEVLAHTYTRQTIKALGASKKLMSITSVDYVVDNNYQGVN